MRNPQFRPFGIADGLVLVAATAVAMAANRVVLKHPRIQEELTSLLKLLRQSPASWSGSDFEAGVVIAGAVLCPYLLMWSLACLVMRRGGGWSNRRRLIRAPGALACLAATGVVVLSGAVLAAIRACKMQANVSIDLIQVIVVNQVFASVLAGAVVFWCWVLLWLCGRWRPEASWHDRLARGLGFAWITWGGVGWLFLIYDFS